MTEQTEREALEALRNCDLIGGMDYLETCQFCAGEGRYNQTYTAGCGQGYFTMKGPCDYCAETGIRTINGGMVSRSHLMQIDTRRQAAIRAAKDAAP